MQVVARKRSLTALTVIATATGAACSGGPQLPPLSTAALPKIAIGETGIVAAGSTAVYARIASGANRCWFGGGGRLRRSHIMHADAASEHRGGAVEIVIHERAVDQPKIWGFKAYRISISETSGQSVVSVENARMPEQEEQRMRTEVLRWADGKEDCAVPPVLEAPPEPAPKAKTTAKK